MKPVTFFWLGIAGLGVFLLLGQLLSYADLQFGVFRLLGLLALGVVVAGSIYVILCGMQGTENLGSQARAALLMGGGALSLLLLIVLIGAI